MAQRQTWRTALIQENADGEAWELFHENSKVSPYDAPLRNREIRARMVDMWPSLPYTGYPTVELPEPPPLEMALSDAIQARHTARQLRFRSISLRELTAILHYGYGQTRDLTDQGYPRCFRVVPSGGALYPLEIYIHARAVPELQGGWYHYSPATHSLQLLRAGDDSRALADAFVQPDLLMEASLLIVITAQFARSTFKYKERGYRFALIEAGHVAQNIDLVGEALKLGVVNIGGFLDRKLDALLKLDGIAHSCVYAIAIGTDAVAPERAQGMATTAAEF